VKIGGDVLQNTADLYRRLRNTFRFLLGALDGFTAAERVPLKEYESFPYLEKYILAELAHVDAQVTASIEAHDYGAMTHALYNLCNATLSSFYFDIRKDRLYCDRPDSLERRACRTVMAEILDFLVTRLAPIIPFTTEEVWQHCSFKDVDSVHLRTFSEVPTFWNNPDLRLEWDDLKKVRSIVLGALEQKRADKTIGSSLEAAPVIYLNDKFQESIYGKDLQRLYNAKNMAEICIVSQAEVRFEKPPEDAFFLKEIGPHAGVVFKLAQGRKCQRCWKILPEVGSDPDYPDLSLRDADAVRYYQLQKKAA
jgi:isoleucyl-tRNA synthetase